MKLTLSDFDGQIPRLGDTVLEHNQAVLARNVRLYGGLLSTWKGRTEVFDPVSSSDQTIYRFENPTTDEELWLTFDNEVHVVPGALADTTDFRLYYTGDTKPRKTNWTMAGDNALSGEYPGEFYDLAVPTPATKPTVAAVGSGSAVEGETRYYVYTYVNTFGALEEESEPSPVSDAVTVTAGQKVNISALATSPAGDHNITSVRIYRTLPGEATVGEYVFVSEVAIGSAGGTIEDDLLAAELGEACPTVGWSPPPDGMIGLTPLANGMFAAFQNNSVYFCEPYFHHAWPAAYIQSIPEQIVGMGSYGNSLVVMTEGHPYIITGVTPDALSVERLPLPEPCVSSKSIAYDQYGVLYASPTGLVSIGPTGRKIITNELFRRREWVDYSPETMIGDVYDGKYFVSFTSTVHTNETMVISRDDKPALSFLSYNAAAWFRDVETGVLYMLDVADEKIYSIDTDTNYPLQYEWKSKRFFMPGAVTWSVCKVDGDVILADTTNQYNEIVADIETANALLTDLGDTFNGVTVNADSVPVGGSQRASMPPQASLLTCTIQFYGELDELMASLTVQDFGTFRLPSFKERVTSIQLTGTLPVRSVMVATSMPELRGR